VIVTCRAAAEGGAYRGSETDRLQLLGQAITLGAEYVDVEWRADRSGLPAPGDRTRLVLSHHDMTGMPADLPDLVRSMRRDAGAGLVKLAVTTSSLAECRRLRRDTRSKSGQVVIGMGPAGLVTRLCPWLYGSLWTYGGTAAPGQSPVADLIDRYRVPQASDRTQVYAVIGAPIAHSASPAMHNAAFAAAGIDAMYVPIETHDAADFLAAAEDFGIAGASVTAPLKTAWAALGVRLDAAGQSIGAINTLVRRGRGHWEGRNFDVEGFLAPLVMRGLQMTGQRVVILGAGGAARAAAWALKRQGARIEVSARRTEAAVRLAADLGVVSVAWPPRPDWDLLINATPVGTRTGPQVSPLDRAFVRGRVVYDLVYNPAETVLMRLARSAGADVIGGLEMLIGQARAQFEYWTGIVPSVTVMEQAATAFLQRQVE
jgi:3-dehydroquinate dehydratase/shikimate dehydrogenase